MILQVSCRHKSFFVQSWQLREREKKQSSSVEYCIHCESINFKIASLSQFKQISYKKQIPGNRVLNILGHIIKLKI